ncbi:hypothetical protein GCM10010129_03100 [Streptomyces fumigatiscleroticus]|nr:hypothetical protein GCM10010129_03100 [Streptomyces fumigatiscleroticus]
MTSWTTTWTTARARAGSRLERWTFAAAREVAARRSSPALHPQGLTCGGTVDVRGDGVAGDTAGWAETGRYEAVVRWSRAAGLPGSLPDAYGLALRVRQAGGPGQDLDLLLTTSGTTRLGRHVPRLRRDALAGPYSTLLSYRFGRYDRVVAALPEPGSPPAGTTPDSWARAVRAAPVRFALCAAGPREPWRIFATLTLAEVEPVPAHGTPGFDPYAHRLPGLHPTGRFSGFREAAYAGSRAGRGGW